MFTHLASVLLLQMNWDKGQLYK